jgi:hypothetical protein
MFLVKIRIADKDVVPEHITTMRLWIDHHRFEPDTFRSKKVGVEMVCRVEFKVEAEADAFAKAFDGRVERLDAVF